MDFKNCVFNFKYEGVIRAIIAFKYKYSEIACELAEFVSKIEFSIALATITKCLSFALYNKTSEG